MIEHLKKIVKKELGTLLVEERVITEEQLEKALNMQKEVGELLGSCLVKLGYATEEDIVNCIMVQYGFPYLPLENYSIDRAVLKLIPEEIALENVIMPVDKIGKILTIAMANPLDINVVHNLEKISGSNIEIFISTAKEILKAIDRNYRRHKPH
ncbi:MAG: hypothetical protein U9Q24_01310 [Candidatus Ratteibacteria bacterium]|nr:hypothetical protein [Candidatus Ratteibacteria bacterium]